MPTSAEPDALARAEAAFPDLRAAHSYAVQEGDAALALTLVSALREYGMRAMRYEALVWADGALACDGATEHPLFPTVMGISAYRAWIRGEFDRALAVAEQIVSDECARGDAGSGLARRVQANVYYVLGRVEEGLAAGRLQVTLAEAANDPSRIAHGAYMLSVALASVGQFDEARELATRAQAMGEATGSPTDLASGWAARGFASHDDVPAALDAFVESDRIASEAGNRWMSAFARTEASALQLVHGQLDAATGGTG